MREPRFDVAIVGAGPAGMEAAIQAADLQLRAAVFDEQDLPGGQIYRAVERAGADMDSILGSDYTRGRALAARFRASGAAYFPRSTLVHVGDDLEVGVVCDGRLESHPCRSLIVATGALERPFPIPGWTLPGVVTAGGVQALLKGSALVPEGRIALAGTGPLAYLIAVQLLEAGLRDLVFLDTTPAAHYAAAARHVPGALRRPDYLTKGLKLVRRARSGTHAYVAGVSRVEALGEGRVTAVRFESHRGAEELAIDGLMLHQGVVPNTQLTRALGLAHEWNPRQLCWRPVLDEWLRASRANVLVAGDSGGVSGAEAAQDTGRIAALQAATDLGALSVARRDELARASRRRLNALSGVRRFLDCLYAPQERHRIPEGATIVCRCEDVTAGEAQAAIAEGCVGPDQLKFFTRCGMGPCQGRYCGLTVTEMIARATGMPAQDVGYYRIRQPVKPLKLGVLATAAAPIEKAADYKT